MGLFDSLFGSKKKYTQADYSDKSIYSKVTGETVYIKMNMHEEAFMETAKTFSMMGDHEAAAQVLEIACDAGHSKCCFELSALYEHGHGVETNIPLSIELLKKSCSSGYGGACLNLGSYYFEEEYYTLAKQFFEKAKDLGHTTAINNLGYLYAKGFGVEKDLRRAEKLFDEACRKGYTPACDAINKVNQ